MLENIHRGRTRLSSILEWPIKSLLKTIKTGLKNLVEFVEHVEAKINGPDQARPVALLGEDVKWHHDLSDPARRKEYVDERYFVVTLLNQRVNFLFVIFVLSLGQAMQLKNAFWQQILLAAGVLICAMLEYTVYRAFCTYDLLREALYDAMAVKRTVPGTLEKELLKRHPRLASAPRLMVTVGLVCTFTLLLCLIASLSGFHPLPR